MKIFKVPLTPEQIAAQLQCRTVFKKDIKLTNVAELNEADENSVCFFENPKFQEELKATKAGLIFVPKDFDITLKPDTNLILLDKPYINFMMMVKTWLKLGAPIQKSEIAKTLVSKQIENAGYNVERKQGD